MGLGYESEWRNGSRRQTESVSSNGVQRNVGALLTRNPPRWVAYQSDENGKFEISIQAFPEPRGAIRISNSGGQYPQWGAGGRELFYVSLESKLMAVSLKIARDSIEPSTPHELFSLSVADMGFSPYEAAPDGRHFLVRATPGLETQPLTIVVNWPALLKKGTSP